MVYYSETLSIVVEAGAGSLSCTAVHAGVEMRLLHTQEVFVGFLSTTKIYDEVCMQIQHELRTDRETDERSQPGDRYNNQNM